jgi:hypothetical protein
MLKLEARYSFRELVDFSGLHGFVPGEVILHKHRWENLRPVLNYSFILYMIYLSMVSIAQAMT